MTPNTRKPTVEEVGDEEKCWVWSKYDFVWYVGDGGLCRLAWHEGNTIPFSDSISAWLPYSAIPDPNNTQQGEPK